jgi:putative addiction module component (TIGR02574 family)
MLISKDDILQAALSLSLEDRLLMAEELLGTLPEDRDLLSLQDPGIIQELDRRWNDGEARISWEEVRAELRGESLE